MRDIDIKILWGRSGNRCAVCKVELTPDGTLETLGEMAHIVARSPDGPRGQNSLTAYPDGYENLILLCPTHHTEVDKNPSTWPVARLHAMKADHETWVSEQLTTGKIRVAVIDNTVFLAERETSWIECGRENVAMVLSITPLRVSGDALNPLDSSVVAVIESAYVPNGNPTGEQVNRYRTRPTEYGLVNEELSEPRNSYGHSIQVFRVGHCEYFCELGDNVDQVTGVAQERETDLKGATRVLRYTDIASVADLGINWLSLSWKRLLPFNYMTFCGTIVNTNLTTLYSREDRGHRSLHGFVVKSPVLKYSEVLPKAFNKGQLLQEFLSRMVNSYGLTLYRVFDKDGNYVRPERMR